MFVVMSDEGDLINGGDLYASHANLDSIKFLSRCIRNGNPITFDTKR